MEMNTKIQRYDKAAGFKAIRYDDRIPRCLELVRRLSPERVLDIGCGNGFFLQSLKNEGIGKRRLAGIEVSADAVREGQAQGLECVVGSADEPLPFPNEAFDLVFAGEVIEHLVDPDVMLAEIRRVLAPSGRLLLTTPNLVAWFNRVLVPLGITPMFVEHSYRATYGPAYSLFRRVGSPVGHLRIFTYRPLRSVLRHNGLEVERLVGSACLPVALVHTVDKIIARMNPRLAANLIVLARRA
jgi:SAM-dependent methyltransferase